MAGDDEPGLWRLRVGRAADGQRYEEHAERSHANNIGPNGPRVNRHVRVTVTVTVTGVEFVCDETAGELVGAACRG